MKTGVIFIVLVTLFIAVGLISQVPTVPDQDFRYVNADSINVRAVKSTKIQSGTIEGDIDASYITGTMLSDQLTSGARNWSMRVIFSSPDHNTVVWTTDSLIFAPGFKRLIQGGTTGDMSALTYIYWDQQVSETEFQVATTFNVTDYRILVCVAQPIADTYQHAFFVPGVGVMGINNTAIGPASISTSNIQALAITADLIAANTITAAKMNVAQLDAISGNFGHMTAGQITVGSATDSTWLNSLNDGYLRIGGLVKNSAPFIVDAAGHLAATSASLTLLSTYSNTSNPSLVATGSYGSGSAIGLEADVTSFGTINKAIIGNAANGSISNYSFYGQNGDIYNSGNINVSSGHGYKINGSALSYSDVGAAASNHDHSGVYAPAAGSTSITTLGTITTGTWTGNTVAANYLPYANAAADGILSGATYTVFNNKMGGSGTAGQWARFVTDTKTLESLAGSIVTSVGSTNPTSRFVATSSGGSPTYQLSQRQIALSNGTVINVLVYD